MKNLKINLLLVFLFVFFVLPTRSIVFSQDDYNGSSDYYDDYYDYYDGEDNGNNGNEGNPLYDSIIIVIKQGQATDDLIAKGDFDGAIENAHTTRKYLADTNKIYSDMKDALSPKEEQAAEAMFEIINKIIDIQIKEIQQESIKDELIKMSKKVTNEKDAKTLLPQLEILERANSELIAEVDSFKVFCEKLITKRVFKDLAGQETIIPAWDLTAWTDWAKEDKKVLTNFKITIQQNKKKLLNEAPDYESYKEKEIPVKKEKIKMKEGIITAEVAKVFAKFDKNGDGDLSLGEGENFYYWVEKNIPYRYDNENAKDPYEGYVVGDGHSGSDYRQTPQETLSDEAGDCEDMGTIESAFYNYWGIESYVIGVNASKEYDLDHMAAIVKLSDTPENFKKIFGGLQSYKVGPGATDVYGKKITPGVYFIVDNAYSSAYGYISGGVKPGKFQLLCIVPADKPFDSIEGEQEKWEAYSHCGKTD